MAELMGGDVGGVIDFAAVSSSRQGRGDRRMSGASSEVLYGDSSQFQVVLKQLGKRDSTTKLKVRGEWEDRKWCGGFSSPGKSRSSSAQLCTHPVREHAGM